ncbi:hypothetical protein I79_003220 [Cricetulus griseus]|uniref:Uncharacterized protein n=1 Tax=Cricetulus griseus TaxID=10029 RepID=G3GZF5_CRIGR|nr:hypothetical protein I79_003220 [Cricetulus griseus]
MAIHVCVLKWILVYLFPTVTSGAKSQDPANEVSAVPNLLYQAKRTLLCFPVL